MQRAVPQRIDRSLRREVVDLAPRQADVHQVPVAQILQGEPSALAPLPKRTPILLEQTKDTLRRWSGGILVRHSVFQRSRRRLEACCKRLVDRALRLHDGKVEAAPCGIALNPG